MNLHFSVQFLDEVEIQLRSKRLQLFDFALQLAFILVGTLVAKGALTILSNDGQENFSPCKGGKPNGFLKEPVLALLKAHLKSLNKCLLPSGCPSVLCTGFQFFSGPFK